jgi:hypothetical protein
MQKDLGCAIPSLTGNNGLVWFHADMSELLADKRHLLEAVPRIRWTPTWRVDMSLADCRALPVDWTCRKVVLSMYLWLCFGDGNRRPVDGIMVPGSVYANMRHFVDVILAHRGWTAVPSNESMPGDEPIFAVAAPCRVSLYAIVDWKTSDIIMLKWDHPTREWLRDFWWDTMLVQYRYPQYPRPYTVAELVRLMWGLMPYRIAWIVACLRAGFRREALLTRAREMA